VHWDLLGHVPDIASFELEKVIDWARSWLQLYVEAAKAKVAVKKVGKAELQTLILMFERREKNIDFG
jgi:hypothetical protein